MKSVSYQEVQNYIEEGQDLKLKNISEFFEFFLPIPKENFG